MSFNRIGAVVVSLTLACAMTTRAQQSQTDEYSPVREGASSGVWHLMRYAGVLQASAGQPRPSVAGVTFSLYEEQAGGAALWIETQNVQVDDQGHYSALLGGTRTERLPVELLRSGKARWLGIQVAGQPEEARVPLAIVPYAVQAGDAETLGGRSAADYALSEQIQKVRDGLQAAGFDLAGGEAASNGSGRKAIPSDPGSNTNPRAVTLEDLNIKLDATLKNLGATTSDANTKLDTTLTNLGTANTKLDTTLVKLDTTNTKLDRRFTDVDATLATTNTKLDTTLTRLNTTVTKLDLILANLNQSKQVFSFVLCTAPGLSEEVKGGLAMEIDGMVEGRLGAEAFGNGVMARLQGNPKGNIENQLGISWDILKFSVCADLGAAAANQQSSGGATPQRQASLTATDGSAINGGLLDKIATLDRNAMLAKMLGLADNLAIDPAKLQTALDVIPKLSFDPGPFAILQPLDQNRTALMGTLPIPAGVKQVLTNPGQYLQDQFKELWTKGICGISPRPAALAPILDPVCAATDPFAPMLRSVKQVTDTINTNVGQVESLVRTMKNNVDDICANTIFC